LKPLANEVDSFQLWSVLMCWHLLCWVTILLQLCCGTLWLKFLPVFSHVVEYLCLAKMIVFLVRHRSSIHNAVTIL